MEELNYMLHKAINDNIDPIKDREYLRSAASVWNNVCGLCLEAQGDLETVDPQLSEIVSTLLSMSISADDPSWKICQPCMSNLKLFYGYREKCTTNHLAMQKLKEIVVDLEESEGAESDAEQSLLMEYKVEEEVVAEEIEIETECIGEGGFELDFMMDSKPVEALLEPLVVIDKKVICPVCGHGVQGRKKLERHMKTHDPGYKGRRVIPVDRSVPSLEITVLPLVVEPMPELNDDIKTPPTSSKRNNKNSICQVCGHAVEGQKKLERHMRTHEPGFTRRKHDSLSIDADGKLPKKRVLNNKYSCPVCGRMVESPNKLKRHMVSHLRDLNRDDAETEATTCPTCFCQFPSVELMNIHMNDHEALKNRPPRVRNPQKRRNVREPYLCYICGKYQATRYSDMKIHIMRHQGEKPFKCEFCQKGFVSTNALRSHRRGHTGEKPYKCRYCPALYSDHTARKEHERRTHTFERPFPCTFCDKAFVCARVLKHHLVTHTGEKNYECKTCGMLFNKAWNLKAHQNVHLREQGKEPIYVRNRKVNRVAKPISQNQIKIKGEHHSSDWESD